MLSNDKGCEICRDILESISIPGSRIVQASEEWAVVATLGPLSEYHLMLVPQRHQHFSLETPKAADFISNAIESWSTLVNGKGWLAFEHANSATGCGIVHAHVHLFACDERLVIKTLFSDLQMLPRLSISELSFRKEELFWCTSSVTEAFAVIGQPIPSQYARSRIAKAQQLKFSSDWRSYTNPEWLQKNVNLAHEFVRLLRK